MGNDQGAEAQVSAPSFPAYPFKRSGSCLVCGFAPTLYDDLARARELRPGASVIVVNQAATEIEAFAVFSLHHKPSKLDVWAEKQRQRFGKPVEVHAHSGAGSYEVNAQLYPYVDYWWDAAKGKGTSAWAAAKLAILMGFSEAILCGVLIDRAPYANATFCRDFRSQAVLNIYRGYIKKDKAWHSRIYAMSGWPRGLLGLPPNRS